MIRSIQLTSVHIRSLNPVLEQTVHAAHSANSIDCYSDPTTLIRRRSPFINAPDKICSNFEGQILIQLHTLKTLWNLSKKRPGYC